MWLLLAFLLLLTPPGPLPAETNRDELRIEIHKSERRLEVYRGARLEKKYRIGLGFDPVSDKRRQGDGATPEGEYFVCVKNPQSQYYLSLGLNYPNAKDAVRGLADRIVEGAEAEAIAAASEGGAGHPGIQLSEAKSSFTAGARLRIGLSAVSPWTTAI